MNTSTDREDTNRKQILLDVTVMISLILALLLRPEMPIYAIPLYALGYLLALPIGYTWARIVVASGQRVGFFVGILAGLAYQFTYIYVLDAKPTDLESVLFMLLGLVLFVWNILAGCIHYLIEQP